MVDRLDEAEETGKRLRIGVLDASVSVIAHVPRFPTLATIVKLKKIWKTSVAALTYRLHALDILSDWEYRRLYIQISRERFRTREPNSEPREFSQVLPKIFAALREDGLTRSKVAHALCIPQSELESLMFGLTMASIEGGRKGTPSRSRLTLVGN